LEDVIVQAVNTGGDTDTIASIAGHVAGAYAGIGSVHGQLVSSIEDSEQLIEVAEAFAAFVVD